MDDNTMKSDRATSEYDVLDAQQDHWQRTFAAHPEMFGERPSESARKAVEVFKQAGMTSILELGAGQGRDTFFFAHSGFHVCALDYSEQGVEAITHKAHALGLPQSVTAICHDVRTPLPFEDESFGGCYSHMLYCMALTTAEIGAMSEEIRRVLQPGGMNIYTVRNTHDAHYRQGIHRGEDIYEVGGVMVHFFSEDKVRQLAKGYEIVDIAEFEEGELPRKLFCVTLRKQ
jgi:SAM-dependent methyltransferase